MIRGFMKVKFFYEQQKKCIRCLVDQFQFMFGELSAIIATARLMEGSYQCVYLDQKGLTAGVTRCHTGGELEEPFARRRESIQARDPTWLWKPVQTSPEIRNRDTNGPTKILMCSKTENEHVSKT